MFKVRLKSLRDSKGMTQQQFADDFGISKGTIGMWESGAREPRKLDELQRISDYFGVSVDYLLGRTDKKEPPAPQNEDGQLHEELDREFMRWFQKQSPARQKEVLFDLAKAVTGHDE